MQRAVMADQRVHAAERVFPVGVGEVDLAAAEGVDDHATGVVAGLVVEVGGVDQAGGEAHRVVAVTALACLPGQEPFWKGLRGRDQCSRTVCPGRIWAILSMSSSITTPITG